ncbi:DUF6316 family protein [Aliikangiella maris]
MRKDDLSTKEYKRTDRIYQKDSNWYFSIRQGAVFGPYESRKNAQKSLESFVSILKAQQ